MNSIQTYDRFWEMLTEETAVEADQILDGLYQSVIKAIRGELTDGQIGELQNTLILWTNFATPHTALFRHTTKLEYAQMFAGQMAATARMLILACGNKTGIKGLGTRTTIDIEDILRNDDAKASGDN